MRAVAVFARVAGFVGTADEFGDQFCSGAEKIRLGDGRAIGYRSPVEVCP